MNKHPDHVIVEIEGMNFDIDRKKSYEGTQNKKVFIVKWIKDETSDNLCLPVYTLENELIGYVRKDVDNIKKLFSEYSDPLVFFMTENNSTILIELIFSHDKDYLENLRKMAMYIPNKKTS